MCHTFTSRVYSGNMPLLICVVGLLLRTQATAPQAEITLKFQPPVGKTYKYRLSTEMSMDGTGGTSSNMKTAMDLDLNVLAKNGDVTTIESKTSHATIDMPDDNPAASMKDSMIEKMNGKVVKVDMDSTFNVKGGAGGGLESVFSSMAGMQFPSHPIKVGETWNSKMDFKKLMSGILGGAAPNATITGDLPIVMQLESVDQVNGLAVATIKMSLTGDLQVSISGQEIGMHIAGLGNIKLEVATGATVSTNMVSDNKISAAAFTMNQHMVQKMVARQ